jgi:uncharacterized membrane protein YfcA
LDTALLLEWLPLAALLLATGLVAGTVGGLLGVGGGIVIVPVLVHVFRAYGIDPALRMHLAVGTSLGTIVLTAARSVQSHRRRGAVDEALLRSLALSVLAGVLAGSALARGVEGQVLSGVFGCVALAVSLHMAFGRESWRLRDGVPEGAPRASLGASIGFVSVLMGLGGGTLGVPILSLLGVPIHRAVGTAAGLGLLIGVPGCISFALAGWGVPGRPPLSVGYVNLLGLAAITPATWLAAPLGARPVEAELVGLIPAAALVDYPADVPIRGFDPALHVIERRLAALGD